MPVDGISQPLLPSNTRIQQQRPSSPWSQFPTSNATGWFSHWQEPDPAQIVALSTCPPDCAAHSEAFHAAEVLLRKIVTFPARFTQQWQAEKTDEVLYWLDQQAFSNAANNGTGLPFQPTRQDAELLRICECHSDRTCALSLGEEADRDAEKSSTSSLASKPPSTAIPTSMPTCI